MKMEDLGLMTNEEIDSYSNHHFETVDSEDVGGLAAAAAGAPLLAMGWPTNVY